MLTVNLFGCRLELKFSFFALLAFCCLFAEGSGGAFPFLAVILHEFAHLAILFFFRAPPRRAEISALGCRIVSNPDMPLSWGRSALVSLAGPGMNLLCFLVMLAAGQGSHPFAVASLALGAFHSLPLEPLDGGIALRSLLSQPFGPQCAAKATFFLSLVLLIPLAALGFWVLLRTRYNFSLLALSVYIMLYLVLKRDFFV